MFSGCGAVPRAESGNTVQVEYTGKLNDGTVFDSSVGKQPLEFTVGSGQVIPGFDQAVTGMKVGDSKTVTIPAADAYGQHNDELVMVVPMSDLPEGLTPKVGQKLQGMGDDGRPITVTITDVSGTTVTVDANHPLAGKDLTFELKLVAIK
ncbi:MAG: peptidylprolyl isomerase [Chloroflexi bacterium]|nr:peptidylprolyl isomerase [Chloroflexota bacterium]